MQSKSDGKAVRQIRNRAFDKLKNRDTNGLKKKGLDGGRHSSYKRQVTTKDSGPFNFIISVLDYLLDSWALMYLKQLPEYSRWKGGLRLLNALKP